MFETQTDNKQPTTENQVLYLECGAQPYNRAWNYSRKKSDTLLWFAMETQDGGQPAHGVVLFRVTEAGGLQLTAHHRGGTLVAR